MTKERKVLPHELILEYTPRGEEEQTVVGTPTEILNHLVENNVTVSLQHLMLSNHLGYLLSQKNNVIIEFLIFQSTEQQLGKVHVGDFMFEVEFRDKPPKTRTALYDIFYVLNRPNNTELTGASKITLVRRTKEDSVILDNIFEYAGKKDIQDLLLNWTKRVHGYETPEQLNSAKAVDEIKDVSQTIHEILSEPEPVEVVEEPAKLDQNVTDNTIKDYAVTEQISAIKELVLKGETEKAVKYIDVLTFLLQK